MHGLTKEQLEAKKLELEVHDLQREWWKRPGYLAVLLPTLIASGTLVTGWLTGYFQNENKLIEMRKLSLEEQERGLRTQVADLATRRDQLETQRANLSKEFKVAQQAQAQQLKDLREKGAAERQRLSAELAKAKENLGLERARAYLSTFTEPGEQLYGTSESARALIALVRKETNPAERAKLVGLISQAMPPAANGPVLRGHLLHVLHRGTGDEKWKAQLFDLAASDPALPPAFWRVFAFGDWPAAELPEVYERLFVIMVKGAFTRKQAVGVFDVFRPYAAPMNVHRRFKDATVFVDGLVLARDAALDRSLPWYERVRGFNALAALAPKLYLVTFAEYIAQPDFDRELLPSLVRGMTDTDFVKSAARSMKAPWDGDRSDPSRWQAWLRDHADARSTWTEPTLKTVRTNLNLLEITP